MAGDEDWLALQIANAQSPFRTFQKPDAPFEASQPGPDTVYTTQDVNRIQGHQQRSNPLRSAFRWVADKIKGYQEAPGGNADEHKLAGSLRLSDIPLMIAESGERYAGGFGHAMRGENRPGMGFAGTGVDEPAMLVPPQAAAGFIPGLRGAIVRGEASPISTYDKVRAKLEESPLLWEHPGVLGDRGPPLPGAPTLPSIWPGPEFLPETGPAWKHQTNPFSEEAGRIRGHLQSLGQETWPKAPPFEDTSPLGPNGSKSMNAEMGRPGNERDVGEVKLRAEGDAKLAPFARRTEPLPLTQGVADWVREATGKEPSLRVARGKNETDYVGLPHGPQERERGLERTKVRVADDGHAGWPEKGLIDTAGAKPGRTDPDVLSRLNAEGQPFSNYQNLIDALKWATSSAPGRANWLVAPGKEPRWARYAKEGPAPKPVEGADFSPEQLKLLAKTGDLKTMLAAARGDPDKLASIRKTIESLKGVSPGGIAKVLETQHGLDVHPGDVPQVLRELDRNRFPMPNQSKPSLQSRIDKAYEHTRPGPRSIRSEPDFPQRFWEAWDRHQGHQRKVADELGTSQSTVYAWKNQIPRPSPQTPEAAAAEAARLGDAAASGGRAGLGTPKPEGFMGRWTNAKRQLPPRVEAAREERLQREASEAELAKRGGKPFWDETGRAAAAESDMKAVRELFGKKPDDTTLYAGRPLFWPESIVLGGATKSRFEHLKDGLAQGRSVAEMAQELGTTPDAARVHLARMGEKVSEIAPDNRVWPKERFEAIEAMRKRGTSWADIAKSEGGLDPKVLQQTVYQWRTGRNYTGAPAGNPLRRRPEGAQPPFSPVPKEPKPRYAKEAWDGGLIDREFDEGK